MSLAFIGLVVGLGFSKAQIAIGLLLMIVHPLGGAEPIVGALQTERYGGQILEEMKHDYPTLNLHRKEMMHIERQRRTFDTREAGRVKKKEVRR